MSAVSAEQGPSSQVMETSIKDTSAQDGNMQVDQDVVEDQAASSKKSKKTGAKGAQKKNVGVDGGDGETQPKTSKKPRSSTANSAHAHAAKLSREPGTSVFPFARTQRIIRADKVVTNMTREGVMLVAIAAEHFVQSLTREAYVKARLDKRKQVTLKDMDIIPATVSLSTALAARKRKENFETAPPDISESSVVDTIPLTATYPSKNPDYLDVLVKRQGHKKTAKDKDMTAQADEVDQDDDDRKSKRSEKKTTSKEDQGDEETNEDNPGNGAEAEPVGDAEESEAAEPEDEAQS